MSRRLETNRPSPPVPLMPSPQHPQAHAAAAALRPWKGADLIPCLQNSLFPIHPAPQSSRLIATKESKSPCRRLCRCARSVLPTRNQASHFPSHHEPPTTWEPSRQGAFVARSQRTKRPMKPRRYHPQGTIGFAGASIPRNQGIKCVKLPGRPATLRPRPPSHQGRKAARPPRCLGTRDNSEPTHRGRPASKVPGRPLRLDRKSSAVPGTQATWRALVSRSAARLGGWSPPLPGNLDAK